MKLLCIANSWRPDGRCVAGIDVRTGEFVRPVARPTDSIPAERLHFGGRMLAVGDTFELDLRRPDAIDRYQRENWLIENWDWRRCGRVPVKRLADYCRETVPILHTPTDRAYPAALDKLAPDEWRSLQLVRPRTVEFEADRREGSRWRARFQDSGGNEYRLRLTDPVATEKLESGQHLRSDVVLLVSLARPWTGPDRSQPPICYKIVATAAEL